MKKLLIKSLCFFILCLVNQAYAGDACEAINGKWTGKWVTSYPGEPQKECAAEALFTYQAAEGRVTFSIRQVPNSEGKCQAHRWGDSLRCNDGFLKIWDPHPEDYYTGGVTSNRFELANHPHTVHIILKKQS